MTYVQYVSSYSYESRLDTVRSEIAALGRLGPRSRDLTNTMKLLVWAMLKGIK